MKRTNWIHFVGKSYYSIEKFINEATREGVSRAMSVHIFKKMELGDRIFLAQKHEKHTKIFGYFIFDAVTGLSQELYTKLLEAGAVRNIPTMPFTVTRGCGSYIVDGMSEITSPSEFMRILKEGDKKDFDRLMVGGKFYSLNTCGIEEEYIISNIPFQQGFRLFDFEQFKTDYDSKNGRVVKGQFYKKEREKRVIIEDARLLRISKYQLN
jgi:hypothetical protein